MRKNIAVLPGDGVGPEIVDAALKVLNKIENRFGHTFTYEMGDIGGVAIDRHGDPFPIETKKICMKSDAILFGAIGDPKYDNDPQAVVRPEQGLLAMRKTLGLFANIRPISVFPSLISSSPLKDHIVSHVDFVVVRELISGIYFGKRGRSEKGNVAYDTAKYSKSEIDKIARYSFELANTRRRKVTLVDKANVLETSRLWREVVKTMSTQFPLVEVEYLFVDNASMQIIKNPRAFDVILTENMFGDILSDEASVIVGSIGLLPSASIGERISLFEPIHGSYPKAAGKNTANPIGTILSAALMLRHSFQMEKEAQTVEKAVNDILLRGIGTKDIFPDSPVSTLRVAEEICKNI